jgi:hypothetical protein
VTQAHAAPAVPATPTLSLLDAGAENTLQSVLARFQSAVQELLDTPLDPTRVVEWATLRTAANA